MTDFLIHIAYLTLSMSFVVLVVLVWGMTLGKRFSAKSRYIVWTVVIISLCVGIALFKLPPLLAFEVDMPYFEGDLPDTTEEIPRYWEDASDFSEKQPSVDGNIAVLPVIPSEPSANTGTWQTTPSMEKPVITAPEAPEKKPAQIDISALVFTVWAVGAALSFAIGLAVYIRTAQKYSRGKKLCDPESEAVFRIICEKQQIKRFPHLYICEDVGSPVLYGYFGPTVLLPNIHLSKNALVGVLAHELTHYRRGDIWIKLICLLAQSLYWFNPFVYIAVKRCNAEMELSCDEEVLSGAEEDVRRAYGNVMLDIVRHCSERRCGLTTGFNPHKNAVKERLLNILDMTKKKKGRLIIAAVLVVCIIAGTVIGCNLKENSDNAVKVFTVEDGVTTVNAKIFENTETADITELVIGKNVEEIDFEYINTFKELRMISVDNKNKYFRTHTAGTGANILLSLKTNEMLYMPAEDNWLQLYDEKTVTDCYKAGEDIKIYSCGAVFDAWYEMDDVEAYWFLKNIEYGGTKKSFDLSDETKHVQISGHIALDAFRINGGFVASYIYDGHSSTYVFAEGGVIEYNPISGENEHAWSYGVPTDGDGVIFYPGENGELCYTQTAHNMVSMQTDDWFWELRDAEQIWKDEGEITVSDGKLNFRPVKGYTVSDYCIEQGTTIDKMFYKLKESDPRKYFKTLDELFEANRISAMEWRTYEYNVSLADGSVKTLTLLGNDPEYYAETHIAQLDGTRVPNRIVLHREESGTGVCIEKAYVLEGNYGRIIPIVSPREVIADNVKVRSEKDAWVLTVSGKDHRIERSQFADYSDEWIYGMPDFTEYIDFSVENGELTCKVMILCAGMGTGYANEYIYIRYGCKDGWVVPTEVSVGYGHENYEELSGEDTYEMKATTYSQVDLDGDGAEETVLALDRKDGREISFDEYATYLYDYQASARDVQWYDIGEKQS